MRVLLLGSGGREHAIARALATDSDVTSLHAAPGNPGISQLAESHLINPENTNQVVALAVKLKSDLVVVGPEAPLMAGVADALRSINIPCFGPNRAAAMIEGLKSYAKKVMTAASIPTAKARTCETESQVAAALDEFGSPYVVKADGLAAGKGVVVTTDRAAAIAHAKRFTRVVIEEYLAGPEVSVFALTDGERAIPLLPAQDYKRAGDGDTGPNTGGMGAYAPLPWAPPDLAARVITEVIEPAIAELRRRGTPYQGLLYAGVALTDAGVNVIEFNARFGDPETQVILDRLATPLGGLLAAAATGDLASAGEPRSTDGSAVTVVIASAGYPAQPVIGEEIHNIDKAERIPGAYILHAGTTWRGETLTSSGGRVLNVVGTGQDLAGARAAAYSAAALVELPGGWYRTDIAAGSQGQ